MADPITCFKAYDVRGAVGVNLTEDAARRIGYAFVKTLGALRIALGGDVRPSSPLLKAAVAEGAAAAGAEVTDLGLSGSEELYFAVFSQGFDGGVEVTGSHNPIEDNGLKLVRSGARPMSGDSGLPDVQRLAEGVSSQEILAESAPMHGAARHASYRVEYVDHLLRYIKPASFRPLRVVADPGNGVAGPVLRLLEERLWQAGAPVEFVFLNEEPDGSFPNGIPNPLLPEKRELTAAAVREHHADIGLAWDGDFDRCFFYDEHGAFIEGYYLVGLLAEAFLARHPGAAIVHDSRLIWNTQDIVGTRGGRAVESKTGHAFMKERMRLEKAVYGGEMSAHHYFAEFAYCDSGMIPWLLVLELMSIKSAPLSALVGERQRLFPCSGELNYTVADAKAVTERVAAHFAQKARGVGHIDGLSMDMGTWRFNLRSSNTEPLLRLNIESRGDAALVDAKRGEIEALLKR